MPQRFYWEAIRDTLAQEMRANPKILLLGEDIGAAGGMFGATQGLLKEFGRERVRDTPICELAFTGAAVGAATCGYRPVVELQYMDFLTLALDPLVNHAAKNRYRSGGQAATPIVLRTAAGAGLCRGPQHSQSLEALLANVPGLLIATPATPQDASGLLRAALRDENDPVIFIEHKALYQTRGEVSDGAVVSFGKAEIRRRGKQVTVVAYGNMANVALAACEQVAKDASIDAELIDLRTLRPLDLPAVLESVRKTGRVLLCSEAPATGNFVSELAMLINEHGFDDLDAPIRRVCGLDAPVPMSPALEKEVIPDQSRVAAAIVALAKE